MIRELWNDLRYRVRALVYRADAERDLHAEIEEHLAREADALERQGVSPAEARRLANINFGALEDVKERTREARGTTFVESVLQDVRYGARVLFARPAFTCGIALTLALGIGANAAMLSLVDGLLFRTPAYLNDSDRVHRVYLTQTVRHTEFAQRYTSVGRYLDLLHGTHSFSTMAAFATQRRAIGEGALTRELLVTGASAAYFDLFTARPVIGRFFTETDDRLPKGSPVAVLGYVYWQTALGGARDVLGRTLRVGDTSFTIIGVAPKNFLGVESRSVPAVYVPFAAFVWDSRPQDHATDYHWQFLEIVAKRKPGVAPTAAAAELTAALNRSWIASGSTETDRAAAKPGSVLGPVQVERGPLARSDSEVAVWVGGVAVIVFLIACANVANLLLARAVTRGSELALRLALGASVGRLARQLFIETTLLALAGGSGALFVARSVGLFVRERFASGEAAAPDVVDVRTIGIVVVSTLAAAVLVGMAPVLHARRASVGRTLGAGGRHTDGRASRARTWLLAAQLSLSVALLIGAGLFVRSLHNARGLHLGYDVEPIVVVSEHRRGDQRAPGAAWVELERRLSEASARLPGAIAASPAASVPFWGFEGYPLSTDQQGTQEVSALGNFILQSGSPDYFRTMGTRIVRGRGFAATDRADSPPVVAVSEGMAHVLWPGRDPIGQCVYMHASPNPPCRTVVGLVDETHMQNLEDAREHTYYVPLAQYEHATGTVMVRVDGRGEDFVESVRQGLQPLMPANAYVTVVPFSTMLAVPMRSWTLGATMFVAFGLLALLVAAVGLYSVIAYGIAHRSREIAIRLALGASRQGVLGFVLRVGLTPVVASIAVGCAIALVAGRWIAPLLFQVSARDPLVYLAVVWALLVVAVIATCLPARRAMKLDPNTVLRSE
jgi:putative ABC transport system permease protein